MDNILFVNACVRPGSRTRELAEALLKSIPGKICQLDLYAENIQPLDLAWLQERTELAKGGKLDHPGFDYAHQFAAADVIVIAAPYWDLLFPAVLRSYLEAVCVTGITFAYTPKGMPEGKCRAKRLYYVTTSGGFIGNNNFGFDYVQALAQNCFGIREVKCIAAEGLDIVGADIEKIMSSAKQAAAQI